MPTASTATSGRSESPTFEAEESPSSMRTIDSSASGTRGAQHAGHRDQHERVEDFVFCAIVELPTFPK